MPLISTSCMLEFASKFRTSPASFSVVASDYYAKNTIATLRALIKKSHIHTRDPLNKARHLPDPIWKNYQ